MTSTLWNIALSTTGWSGWRRVAWAISAGATSISRAAGPPVGPSQPPAKPLPLTGKALADHRQARPHPRTDGDRNLPQPTRAARLGDPRIRAIGLGRRADELEAVCPGTRPVQRRRDPRFDGVVELFEDGNRVRADARSEERG